MLGGMPKPSVFIGSSTEGLEVARAVRIQLMDDAEITLWNEGIFELSLSFLESLVNALDRFDFAILVLTPDDLLVSRDNSLLAPRDNLILELGLFMGRLGRQRTFVLCADDPHLRLPSDLQGISVARYNAQRPDLVPAVGKACDLIRMAIRTLGLSEARSLKRLGAATDQVEGISQKIGHLVQLVARSRIIELDVIEKTLGFLLPSAELERIRKDLRDLQEAVGP
jgi:hypothetical protein